MVKKQAVTNGVLHESGEDYLEAILALEQSKGSVRSIDLVRYLDFSKPSISRAIYILRDAGYLKIHEDHTLHLTPEGRKIAEDIYERHQFFTSFLVKLGVAEEVAEADACKMEHCISAESFQRLKEFIHSVELPHPEG